MVLQSKDINVQACEILKYAIQNCVKLYDVEEQSGKAKCFVNKRVKSARKVIEGLSAVMTKEQAQMIIELKKQYDESNNCATSLSVKNSKPKYDEKQEIEDTDIEADEDYESSRSKCWFERDNNGDILKYCFEIHVRGEKPFIGFLSRSEMETIYSLYPTVTRNSLSQSFLRFTVKELSRILRVFNITKDKKFPPHIVEEYSDEELDNFALRAKERAAYKRLEEKENQYYKGKYQELFSKYHQLKDNKAFYEELIEKLSTRPIQLPSLKDKEQPLYNNKETKSLFTVFSDIHFGKYNTKRDKFGRGNNKDILKQRCIQIARNTIQYFNNNKHNFNSINMLCLGDIFESVLSEGMHHEHFSEMDLFGSEQVLFAYDVFIEMIDIILSEINVNYIKSLNFHLIGGNHDRIGKERFEDKHRTATNILFGFLNKKYENTDFINFKTYSGNEYNGLMKFEEDKLSFIGNHGDTSLVKRKPTEIMNQHKVGHSDNFTIMLNGHFHSMEESEGINYVKIQVGSVCSPDNYTYDNLNLGSQPSFIIGHRPLNNAYGFEYVKKVLA